MPYPGTSPNHRNANSGDYESQLQTVLFNVWRSRLRHPVAAGTKIATLVRASPPVLTGDLTDPDMSREIMDLQERVVAVAEGQGHNPSRIPMPIAIVLDGLDQPLDLTLG